MDESINPTVLASSKKRPPCQMKRPASPGCKNNRKSWKNVERLNVGGNSGAEVILVVALEAMGKFL